MGIGSMVRIPVVGTDSAERDADKSVIQEVAATLD